MMDNSYLSAEIKVDGMNCGHCASSVRKALGKIDGLENVSVNLLEGTVKLRYDHDKVSLIKIKNVIKEIGFSVSFKQEEYKIAGMDCSSCAAKLQGVFTKVPGVVEAKVNVNDRVLYLEYDPGILSSEEIEATIRKAGYDTSRNSQEEKISDDEQFRKNLRNTKLRALLGIIIGFIVFIAGMKNHGICISSETALLQLFILSPVIIYVSFPIFKSGFLALRKRRLNVDLMYSLGIGISYISSLLATFGIFLSKEFIFFDTSLLLASFLMLGRFLEAGAREKTNQSVRRLLDLKPKKATVIRDFQEVIMPVTEIIIGDKVIVKPGEMISTDGVIISGESQVDESLISGEPLPAYKKPGEAVTGGTINKNGTLKIDVTRIGNDTFLSQVIKLVKDAQTAKPEIQKTADLAVSYFIPFVMVVSVFSFILWYFIMGYSFYFALSVLISVLVIACPCALGLATPAAVAVGVGRGAELGILIKNSEIFELSSKLKYVVLDKTGTITKGMPYVTDIMSLNDTYKDTREILRIAASLENNSSHPISGAVLNKARDEGIEPEEAAEFQYFEGRGIKAQYKGKKVILGNEAFLSENGILVNKESIDKLKLLYKDGKTVVLIAVDGTAAGVIAAGDEIKESSGIAVSQFKAMGIDVGMITGDNEICALAVANSLGIKNVKAHALPKDKSDEIVRLRNNGLTVAFIGDGINDAPALSQADIGIALNSGTDIAKESGQIILMKDDLRYAVAALQLGKKIMSVIRMNVFWAFFYNILLIPVASGWLYPLFGIKLKPEFCGLAMSMSCVIILSVSLLLRFYTPLAIAKKKM